MNEKDMAILEELKAKGLTPEQEERFRSELAGVEVHRVPEPGAGPRGAYAHHDLLDLQDFPRPMPDPTSRLRGIDELLERDRMREKDGFPRKIRVGRMIKPGRGGKDKVVVVPTTVEEKLIHDTRYPLAGEEPGEGGSGEGEEGDVVGEQPVRESEQGQGAGPGQGEGGEHDVESSAYELGRILTEKFELPNLKDKGKKRFLTRYTYDLTDRNRGVGQVLDKKATLRRVVETNIHLGNVSPEEAVDPTRLLIAPGDKVYRVLSREKDYESQAVIFLLRDYSGSMSGKVTELVVAQHVLIYSWLLYQYARQVETRFILHDTEAKEVPDFNTYYNASVAGGTRVARAYQLVNEIVERESLDRDYNIYVFHGTDGDDWDTEGKETVPEIERMIGYTSRVGVTVIRHAAERKTEVEKYLEASGLLENKPDLLQMDALDESADEPRLIEGIKKLIV
ncbi:MAG: DUF444 family protein [Desulfobacteraceae bacterium]|nr:DUF444 family protein [Desulfobacteraceae bacterium]